MISARTKKQSPWRIAEELPGPYKNTIRAVRIRQKVGACDLIVAESSPEHAALIVRAVNAHTEFVEAAKFCCTIMGFGVAGIIRLRAVLKSLGEAV